MSRASVFDDGLTVSLGGFLVFRVAEWRFQRSLMSEAFGGDVPAGLLEMLALGSDVVFCVFQRSFCPFDDLERVYAVDFFVLWPFSAVSDAQ